MTAAIGVDLGSNGARALALDPAGAVLGTAAGGYPDADAWPPGRADADGWLTAVAAAVRDVVDRLPGGAAPAAICVGGQSPVTVAAGGGLAVTCRHPAGATLSPVEQHRAQSAVLRDELQADVVPAQAYDWVAGRLGAEHRQSRWPGDEELPGYGPAVSTGEPVGTTSGAHGLPAGVPLVAGAQDAYLAFWAGGIDTPGRAMDPGGRTGGLAVAVDAGRRDPTLFALRSAAVSVDIVGGPVSGHGLALEWLRDLTGCRVDELLALAATVPPGAAGVTVLPYFEGERAPRWERRLRAEVVGLTTGTGRAELARAVLEGTAYGLAHIAEQLRGAGVGIDVLVCAGSPARSELWCAIKAAVLGVPVLVPAEPDLAAYGAALAAGAGAGWWPPPAAGAPGDWPRPAMATVPARPDPAYRSGYRTFVALGDAAQRRVQDQASREEQPCPTP